MAVRCKTWGNPYAHSFPPGHDQPADSPVHPSGLWMRDSSEKKSPSTLLPQTRPATHRVDENVLRVLAGLQRSRCTARPPAAAQVLLVFSNTASEGPKRGNGVDSRLVLPAEQRHLEHDALAGEVGFRPGALYRSCLPCLRAVLERTRTAFSWSLLSFLHSHRPPRCSPTSPNPPPPGRRFGGFARMKLARSLKGLPPPGGAMPFVLPASSPTRCPARRACRHRASCAARR